MRKLPLLVLFPSAVGLTVAGSMAHLRPAASSVRPRPSLAATESPVQQAAQPEGSVALASITVTALTAAHPSGLARYATAPLSFSTPGGHVLGSYVPPALRRRLEARAAMERRRVQIERRRVQIERHRAQAVALAARRRAQSTQAGGVWLELRECESGDDYGADTGNGYYGAYQFLPGTWASLGYGGSPSAAPPAVQDAAAQRLQARDGWGSWPVCSVVLGLR